jgi:hypothetical protein
MAYLDQSTSLIDSAWKVNVKISVTFSMQMQNENGSRGAVSREKRGRVLSTTQREQMPPILWLSGSCSGPKGQAAAKHEMTMNENVQRC